MTFFSIQKITIQKSRLTEIFTIYICLLSLQVVCTIIKKCFLDDL